VAGTLLKAIVGTEIFDEEWHPIVTRDANNTDTVAVRADYVQARHQSISVRPKFHLNTLKLS